MVAWLSERFQNTHKKSQLAQKRPQHMLGPGFAVAALYVAAPALYIRVVSYLRILLFEAVPPKGI